MNPKKIKLEYLLLIVAWIFWGFSNAIIWIQQAKDPNYTRIIFAVLVQTINCTIYNLIAIAIMLRIEKKVKYFKKRYFYFGLVIVILSFMLVLTNVTCFNLISGIWDENVDLFRSFAMYLVFSTEKIIYLSGFCTMFFLIRNMQEMQKQKSIAEEAQQKARDAQLQLLQQQLSPHFLFNTLNSLRSLITINPEKARNMVTELSEFLRFTLSSNKSVQNTIADEIIMVEHYLKIQKVRFDDDLIYTISVDDDLNSFIVPKFILQPLVENAVKYGMQTSKMPLEVAINITRKQSKMVMEIVNTGTVMDNNQLSHSHNGFSNTLNRLELMFPEKASLSLIERENEVFCTILIDVA